MKFSEAQSNSIKEQAEKHAGSVEVGRTCKHGLEHKKCKECSKEYHNDEKGTKTEGSESLKSRKKMIHERVKDLKEDKKTIPVFQRTSKGLKYSHTKEY